MQIETFKIFRDLVETASFSKAAELNAITQSAVSQQIRALEKRFKTALIRRTKKNFSITPEGKALLQASQEILRTYENLGDRLRELNDHVSGKSRHCHGPQYWPARAAKELAGLPAGLPHGRSDS